MIKSYCKINLFLRVLKKLKNGLHNIQSNTVLLELHDEIQIKKSLKKKDKIIFKGKFSTNINKDENSITKTMFLLRKSRIINNDKKFKIIITKKIPVYSGLGGGSSNAAFIIKYFLKNKLNEKYLSIFEKKIGSDLRLFLFKNSIQHSLKKVKEFKKKYKFYFVIVFPYIKSSTKKVYSNVKKNNTPIKLNMSNIQSIKDYINFLQNKNNDLQEIVEKKNKKINKILNLIDSQKNCHISRMTGSGSVCFGLFTNKKSAIYAKYRIQKKLQNCWCVLTKTI